MVLLAGFQTLLARYSGQGDIAIGTPVAGRKHEETEPLIGLFINTLVLRARIAPETTFAGLVAQARERSLAAFAHQEMPFERLVDALGVERSLAFNPVFQVSLVLMNTPQETFSLPGLEVYAAGFDESAVQFDLQLAVEMQDGRLAGSLKHASALFDGPTAERLAAHLETLLAAGLARPERRIAELPLLRAPEIHHLTAEWNDPRAAFAVDQPLHRRFEEQAARRPQASAVVCDLDQLSYGELDRRANQLARRLAALGVAPGDRVGLCLDRSLDLVVGLLGILKAGAAYLPLDPAYPGERLAFMLADGGVRTVVTAERFLPRLAALGGGELAAVCLDRDAAALAAESSEGRALPDLPDAAAYVIYTSGSTGRPKGVEVSHAQVARLFAATGAWFGFGERDVWTLFHSFAFDFSVWEIWGALLHGGELVVVSHETSRSPAAFLTLLRTEGVTVLNQTPSAFRQLLAAAEAAGFAGLARLRYVIFGGEALDVPSLAPWFAHFGSAPAPALINMYGITETTVHVTYRPLVAADLRRPASAIGVPLPDLQVHLADAHGNLVPAGVAGEMLIGGTGVARGYLGRPELTAERFVPDPWSGAPGARLYRAGDLARRRPHGELEYLGRIDHQVKIRGFRIELGEIETALAAHPAVGQCTVVARGEGADRHLVAYLVSAPERPRPGAAELREHLAALLPEPMVPSAFVALDVFPLGPTGKLDRRALPAPEEARLPGAEYLAPRSPAERLLAALMAEVLGRERIGVRDDFFALGGHSLLATRLLGRLRETVKVELPLRELFEAPTVEALALVLERRWVDPAAAGALAELPTITPDPARRHEPFPLTDLQQAYWIGHTDAYELGGISPHSYQEIDFPALDVGRLESAWRRLVERHDALRLEILPDGRQRIGEPHPERLAELRIEVVDLRAAGAEEAAARLLAIRGRMAEEGPDLAAGPLWQLAASLLPEGGVRLHVSLSLLACDARSFGVLARELTRLYADPAAALPPLAISPRDYVTAVAGLAESAAFARALAYWQERMVELPPGPELPLAKAPAAVRRSRFVHREARLGRDAWRRLQESAGRAGLTPTAALATAYAEAIAAWSRHRRFVLDLLYFNVLPLHTQVQELVANLSSTLLVEVDATGGGAFAERARRLQEQVWRDMDHALVSGVRVLRELTGRQGGARASTPVVFASTLGTRPSGEDAGTPASGERAVFAWLQTPQVWIDAQVYEADGELVSSWYAVEELFPAGLLDALFAAYVGLVGRLADDDDAWREPVGPLAPATELALRAAVNATAAPPPAGPLHAAFWRRAAESPQAPAVLGAGWSLTYGELAATAAALAVELRAAGARRDRLVGIVLDKGWEQAAAALAVLEAGAAYLPIDPGLPPARFAYLLANGGVEIALTTPHLDAALAWPAGVRRIGIAAAADGAPVRPPAIVQSDDDLAYVIFTSGSTGLPKGVVIDHRGALNTVADVNARFAVTAADRTFAISALNFDLSVYDLFGPLAVGGAVVMPEAAALREPARWSALAHDAGATIWSSVPALVEMWVDHLESRGERLPPALRLVMLSGDWIPVSLPDRIRRLGGRGDGSGGVEVVSLGGATEASIWSILYPLGEVDPLWPSIPYGRPMVNQTIHVLDDALAPRPVWVAGDLYIGGAGVARGYWADEEKTHAAFVTHPATGERLYRTGDVGRYLPSGDVEFLGREDAQVKIQGFRIELGEIETALAAHPAVRAAVAAAIGPRHGAKRLVAYLVPADPERPPEAADLRAHLAAKLPSYMVPAAIVTLAALPLTANGKVDRAALPDPEAAAAPAAPALPRDAVEAALAALYAELLGVDRVSLDGSFFDLGGHSMLAVRLLGRVRAELGVELPLAALLAGGSVAALAAAVRAALAGGAEPTGDLVAIQRAPGTERPPLFFVHAVGGSVLGYLPLAQALGAGQTLWGLAAPSAAELPAATLEELAARYVAAVRRVRPHGPYHLGGWSMGGAVAYEMARQLAAAGEEVALVAMLDVGAPAPPGEEAPDDTALAAWFARDLAAASGGDDRALHLAAADRDRLFATFRRNYRALLAYAPGSYAGPVALFAAAGGYGAASAAAWRALAPAAEVVPVTGDHYTLLAPPHLERLAAELARRLGAGAPPAAEGREVGE